jgi:hypothetical protein
MSSVKITELSSSGPLTGSEVLPIVQGNETVKTTVQEIGSFNRPYKVYTALLTQSGSSNVLNLNNSNLTIGVTYEIDNPFIGTDFTNVGAPNNLAGTKFVATGTIPNSWGTGGGLNYDTGAPVVTVLENTLGNVWFTYDGTGLYSANSDAEFTVNKTVSFNSVSTDSGNPNFITIQNNNVNNVTIKQFDSSGVGVNPITAASIEIRVYN